MTLIYNIQKWKFCRRQKLDSNLNIIYHKIHAPTELCTSPEKGVISLTGEATEKKVTGRKASSASS